MKIHSKKLKQIIREEVESAISEEEYDQATPEQMLDQLIQGVQEFSQDPEVLDALGKGGLAGAIAMIRNKIRAGDEPSGDGAPNDGKGLDSVMEKELTKPEKKEKEKIVKGMKKDKKGFKQRYGDDAESVMYATATKLAKEKK